MVVGNNILLDNEFLRILFVKYFHHNNLFFICLHIQVAHRQEQLMKIQKSASRHTWMPTITDLRNTVADHTKYSHLF